MNKLITDILSNEGCKIIEKQNIESSLPSEVFPDDMKAFYSYCSGAVLFEGEDYQMRILEPSEIKLANPIIVGELCEYDISSNWYIICKDMNGDYITIDTRAERIGYCYDSHWERHGVPGECKVIAKSFSDLIHHLLETKGKYCYWLEDSFASLGDAYDGVDAE